MKVCNVCKIEKQDLEFYKDARNRDGLGGWCKSCRSNYYHNKNLGKNYETDFTKTFKECNRCGETKSIKHFHKHRRMADGFNSECKERITKRYSDIEYRFRSWRKGAKRRGIEFNVDIEYLNNLSKRCYYTGMELTLESNKENTISLDRIDSSKGYIKGNLVFCCESVNYMKGSLSIFQFVDIAPY